MTLTKRYSHKIKTKEEVLNQEFLKSILEYNPKTGIFTWIKIYHKSMIGKKAGSKLDTGYIKIEINDINYSAHRLAWLYMMGKWPKNQIDHINGIRDDNRFCNLREATGTENQGNKKLNKNNTSGYRGVSWNKNSKKWESRLKVNDKRIYLGSFNSKKEAALAYNRAALEYFGEFAYLNEIKK
jgi:hypothetical protein